MSAVLCHCLVQLDSGDSAAPPCAATGALIGDTAVDAGRYTYSMVTAPNRPKRCKQICFVRDGEETVAPLRESCLGWSGAVIDRFTSYDGGDTWQPLRTQALARHLLLDR